MYRKLLVVLTLLVVVSGVAAQLHALPADTSQFGTVAFPLEGSQSVPSRDTEATGQCEGVLNPGRTDFSISCTQNVANALAAHIHRAPAGENGPIVFFLDAGTTFSYTVNEETLPSSGISFAEFLEALAAGDLYVNVHSQTYPGGEIRGQIPPPPYNLLFAQFGNGQQDSLSLASDIVLLNSATTGPPVTGEIHFYDEAGGPLDPNSFLLFNNPTPSPVLSFDLPNLGDLTVGTTGTGEIVQGWARVTSDAPLGGVIRFDITGAGVAGVGASPVLSAAMAPARRAGTLNTAMAILNPGTEDIVVGLSLLQNGVEVENGSGTVDLAPGERIADLLDELFPDVDTSEFVGSVVMTSDGAFAAIALEFDLNGVFTTLPVTPLR